LEKKLNAGKAFFSEEKKGFFAEVAKARGIKRVEDIPKEFPTIEYEVKFDVRPEGIGTEPSVVNYLDAFDFPLGGNTRFMKDPVNSFAVGINHFIGDENDERLSKKERSCCSNKLWSSL
jgi:hypothetical protein